MEAATAAVPVLHAEHLAPHSWYLRGEAGAASRANFGFNSNAGFVVTSDGVVAFDSLGTPALGARMLEAIRAVTDQPVRMLVISHWHADHFYGAAAFRTAHARVLALDSGREAWHSERSVARLAQRQVDLAPWVDAHTQLLGADEWIHVPVGTRLHFRLGDVDFDFVPGAGAHTPEDLMLYCEQDGVLFAGDVYFSGRIPYVGDADTRAWLTALDGIAATHARIVVPGHGPASRKVEPDIAMTRDYLLYLRRVMGAAARDLIDFDLAYRQADWHDWSALPAFADANRINAYGVYLEMEQEALAQP
ncbi:MAG: MBL fold metallo-hydrolase [Pseudomonadota bacterium]|nr:MBL fold metallo-hydrolase [Pseudomonadota bacterium]